MKSYGIIYKVTNTHNSKCYIGKTKSHYGEMDYGAMGRIRQHFINAFINSRKNECPLFYNAIRKYGKEAFQIEILLTCSIEDYDKFEIMMIKTYDSTNKNFGYNIALGGKGRSIVHTSEDIRLKISNSQTDSRMNIKHYYRDEKLVGYRVRRREKGICYQKLFSSQKNSSQQNLKLAEEWLNNVIEEKPSNNPYNREQILPRNIIYAKNSNGTNIGFTGALLRNKKRYSKTFSSPKFNMEEKYEFVIEWLNNMRRDNFNYISPYDDMKHIITVKNKNGINTGYIVKIIKDKKRYSKGFEKNHLTMKEKLLLAIEYRNELLISLT